MKNSILILGIALVSLTNVCNASNIINNQINQERFFSDSDIVFQSNEMGTAVTSYLKKDTEIFNPEVVIKYDNRKTVTEIIRENDKITEYVNTDELEFNALEESMKEVIAQSDLITEYMASDEDYTIYNGKGIEDEIAELELIIDSGETDEVSQLDFKKINSNSMMMINVVNCKTFVGMK